MILALLLALQLAGLTDADYDAARARENPTVAQAQEVVTEAIRRGEAGIACADESCFGFGDSVIVTGDTTKRSECIIESEQRMTCMRSTQLTPSHFHFDPPSVNRVGTGALDIAAIVAAERAWVGLPPLE